MAYLAGFELAAHLGIYDADDDVSLELAAEAACADIQMLCGVGREFARVEVADAYERLFTAGEIAPRPRAQGVATYELEVDDFWTTAGLVVNVDDQLDGSYSTTWTYGTDFTLSPANGRAYGQPWPYYRIRSTSARSFVDASRRNAPQVRVTAAWGWPAVPAQIRQATLIQAAHLFKRKDSTEGVLQGAAFLDGGAVRISRTWDPDVTKLISAYRRRSSSPAKSVRLG